MIEQLHLVLCLLLTGLIWTVQIVHYPLMSVVKTESCEYAKEHQKRMSWLVLPLMVGELATALFLMQQGGQFWFLNALGVFGLWLATALLSVPQHRKLLSKYDKKAIRMLVKTNWIRTALWSLRSLALLWFVGGFTS